VFASIVDRKAFPDSRLAAFVCLCRRSSPIRVSDLIDAFIRTLIFPPL